MRIESSVTSLTWIPSEAVAGATKLAFSIGLGRYDVPPPDTLALPIGDTVEQLRQDDRFRFVNHLAAWIEVDEGRIVGHGQSGGGTIGSTTLNLGRSVTLAAVAYGDLRPEPEVGDRWVRFRQSAGGRTGAPAPRRVNHPPYVKIAAPTAWTTLELTLHVDGRSEIELVGASPFPRHWVYDASGALVRKSGMIDFHDWFRNAFGRRTPWGAEDSPAVATEVETALERELSASIMGATRKPRIRKVAQGATLIDQGDVGDELFLLLDGVLGVEIDGERIAELGPGAIVGERAILEDGVRSSSLVAVTGCKVAVAHGDAVDHGQLAALSRDHRREEQTSS